MREIDEEWACMAQLEVKNLAVDTTRRTSHISSTASPRLVAITDTRSRGRFLNTGIAWKRCVAVAVAVGDGGKMGCSNTYRWGYGWQKLLKQRKNCFSEILLHFKTQRGKLHKNCKEWGSIWSHSFPCKSTVIFGAFDPISASTEIGDTIIEWCNLSCLAVPTTLIMTHFHTIETH